MINRTNSIISTNNQINDQNQPTKKQENNDPKPISSQDFYQALSNFSPEEQSLINLAIKILNEEKLPSRKELLKEISSQIQYFAKNPTQYIQRAKNREEIANELYEVLTGNKAPSKAQIYQGIFKELSELNTEQRKDLAVNTGGFIGSIWGSSLGLPGQLAGDLIGALIIRKAIDDIGAIKEAYARLQSLEEGKQGNLPKKIKSTLKEAKQILNSEEQPNYWTKL